MLRGHLPVFHDLLDLGSFVLKPDFHLGGGTKAHVTGTLRGCPRLSLGGERRLFWPLDYPVPVSPSSCLPIASTLQPWSIQGVGSTESPGLISGTRLQLGCDPKVRLLFSLDLSTRVGPYTSAPGRGWHREGGGHPLLLEG